MPSLSYIVFKMMMAGVLTKPDLVTTALQQTRWMDVIEGRAHALKHGYYCTRQPDDDQRAKGVPADEARAAEADFFARTLPWARHAHTGRFGTSNLVLSLSRLLEKMINDKYVSLYSGRSRVNVHLSCIIGCRLCLRRHKRSSQNAKGASLRFHPPSSRNRQALSLGLSANSPRSSNLTWKVIRLRLLSSRTLAGPIVNCRRTFA